MKYINAILLFLLLSISCQLHAEDRPQVFVADIDGTVDLGMVPYIRRVINEAENSSAKLIIFRINTFGGRVDAATQIKDAILNSDIETVAFIDKRAISAGALLAISCRRIVMTPGSSIGASTVVDEQGNRQSEKYQSYMRSEMRSTAEKNGRRPDIAEAMVDERITVEGLDDSTKLVTLTALEAGKYGYADTVMASVGQYVRSAGLNNAEITYRDTNWAEQFVRFINNPLVSSILIMIGLVGLFVEIKTPGWGVPGTAALIALVLFFGAGYIVDLASTIEIIVFVIGVVLIILEIFVIPGFGFAGIAGIVMIAAGLFMALIGDFRFLSMGSVETALIQMAASFLGGIILVMLLWKYLPKTKTFNKLILHQQEVHGEGFVSNPQQSEYMGLTGTAQTVLRPAGTVVINGKRLDVISEGDFIDKGLTVEVVKVEGSKIIVREKKA